MKKSMVGVYLKVFSLGAVVLAVVVVIATFGGTNFAPKADASTSTSTTQTINVTVNQVITLALATSTLNLSALTPGTPVSATSSATVTTNASAGFSLSVNRNSPTSTIASGTITFPDATAFNGSNATTAPGANLSFREYQTGTTPGDYSTATWGANDTGGTAMYAGFPTAAQAIASTSTYVGTAQTIVYGIQANAPATQVATSYSGSITVTALALP